MIAIISVVWSQWLCPVLQVIDPIGPHFLCQFSKWLFSFIFRYSTANKAFSRLLIFIKWFQSATELQIISFFIACSLYLQQLKLLFMKVPHFHWQKFINCNQMAFLILLLEKLKEVFWELKRELRYRHPSFSLRSKEKRIFRTFSFFHAIRATYSFSSNSECAPSTPQSRYGESSATQNSHQASFIPSGNYWKITLDVMLWLIGLNSPCTAKLLCFRDPCIHDTDVSLHCESIIIKQYRFDDKYYQLGKQRQSWDFLLFLQYLFLVGLALESQFHKISCYKILRYRTATVRT